MSQQKKIVENFDRFENEIRCEIHALHKKFEQHERILEKECNNPNKANLSKSFELEKFHQFSPIEKKYSTNPNLKQEAYLNRESYEEKSVLHRIEFSLNVLILNLIKDKNWSF